MIKNKNWLKIVCVTSVVFFFNACGDGFAPVNSEVGDLSSNGNPPPPPGPVTYPKDGDYPIIPSNFNTAAWYEGTIGQNVPGTAAPDVVGAFRFICNASHNGYNDPIVYPGQKGVSHLHTFFGNTLTDENSTYESLRTTGDSSCQGGPLNRSAYWIPSLINGKGKVVMPDFVSIYYKAKPNSHRIPRGLRMIMGYNMKYYPQPVPKVVKESDERFGEPLYWNCDGPGAVPGHYPDIAAVIAAGCPLGTKIGAVTHAPDCWDGVNLDSPDHRSHLTYKKYGMTGVAQCPATHPVELPTFTIAAWYTHDGPADLMNWYLSSDRMGSTNAPSGSTFHSDWFGAWDDPTMDIWSDHCLDKLLNCSGFQLGDGRAGKYPATFSFQANPRLVDVPVRPTVKGLSKMHMHH